MPFFARAPAASSSSSTASSPSHLLKTRTNLSRILPFPLTISPSAAVVRSQNLTVEDVQRLMRERLAKAKESREAEQGDVLPAYRPKEEDTALNPAPLQSPPPPYAR